MTVTEEHTALLDKLIESHKNDATFPYHQLYKFIDSFSDYIISSLGLNPDKSMLTITPLDLCMEKGKYKIHCKATVYYPNSNRDDTYLCQSSELNIFINPKSQRLTISKIEQK